jgi:class 3 adenylate cyclase/tetratricopeptide (TPR) repeat protein
VLEVRESEAGERKEVTVLIADVAGSLAMAEALDIEDTHALMNGFFALAMEAIHREGGMINQFRGDGFMALFGAPRAHGDDTVRALRAALEVREQARSYAESVRARYGLPFAIRIGISTGLVWVGAIGNGLRRDYTAEGPTVGLAARLEQEATAGQILVAEGTERLAHARFEFADLGSRTFRGIAEPVRVHELVGELRADLRRARESDRGDAAFVGRGAEVAEIRRALAAGGPMRRLEIRGEPGIGKSRLAREIARMLPPNARTLTLACVESGAQRAYRPWLELLRAWPDASSAEEAAHALGALEGRSGADSSPEAVAGAVRALLGGLLAAGPLLLVLDDAQWLDPSSLRLLDELCAPPPPGSLTVVATLRGDEPGVFADPASRASIRLGPLPQEDALRLARTLLGDIAGAADLAELAWLRGGGNPLFVEEVARALREGAEAVRDAARAEVSLARLRDRVPETLHGVVAARIDALPEPSKRLLEAAAVVGEPFASDLLAAVEPGVAGDPDRALAELRARGLLAPTASGTLDFCHGVVRSGAYAQLVRERRTGLHRAVADVLAKLPVGESADGAARIGQHYDRAGDGVQAARHLLRAGTGYTALRAFREATAQLGRAYELTRGADTGDAQLEAAIGLGLAGALGAQDRSGEAAAVLESLDLEGAGAGDRLRLAFARVHAGWLRFSNDNEVARGRRLIEEGVRLVEGLPGSDDVAMLGNNYLARIEVLDGEIERSLAAARRMLELGIARGDSTSVAAARQHESAALGEAGRAAEALRVAREALFETRSVPSDLAQAMVQLALARASLLVGEVEASLEAAQRCAELAERAGQVGLRFNALAVRGHAHLLMDAPREAHRAFDALRALNDRWPSTWLYCARGRLEVGDRRGAAEAAERCLSVDPPRAIRARALAVRGLAVGLASGGRDGGEAHLAAALDLAGMLGLRPAVGEAHEFLAELCAKRGDAARAERHAETAAREFAACGMPLHAARARAGSARPG